MQEGHRGTEVAGSRVAGGWQGDRKPEVARSGWVSQVGRRVKAVGRRARVFWGALQPPWEGDRAGLGSVLPVQGAGIAPELRKAPWLPL